MSNVVTAYQTLEDRDNIDQIEMEGPYKCTRSNAWLGHGYYFWDTNMKWAIEWGKNSYEKITKDFVIGQCRVDLSTNCFDLLGSVADQLAFEEAINALKESGKLNPNPRLLVPNIIQFMKNAGIFNYKSIRSYDIPNPVFKVLYRKGSEYLILNQRVQICVIKKENVLLRPFSVIYPEKYLP